MEKNENLINLDDLIFEMETRPKHLDHHSNNNNNNNNNNKYNDNDLWAQLQQKEADILLAAELGKALLAKNQELTKQLEKTVEEYSIKIETLQQEKHILKQKLALAEDENDQRVLELQSDLSELREKLEAQENAIRQAEREKATLINELTLQNSRLNAQIQEAHTTEAKITAQLHQLKEQYNSRNSSLQEHVDSLDSLREELRILNEKRNDLENRLHHSDEEKESLQASLEEASDRIHMLERHAKEQEVKLKAALQTLDRFQRENNTLTERLSSVSYKDNVSETQSQIHGPKSLLHEMECDEEDLSADPQENRKIYQIINEARSVYKQLKSLCDYFRTSHDDDSGLHSDLSLESMDVTISAHEKDSNFELRQGMLSSVTDDLTRFVLNLDAAHLKELLEQTRTVVLEQDESLKNNQSIIKDLETKLSVLEVQLNSALEERDQARKDASQSSSNQDEIVSQAREDRDKAVARCTKAEIDLAKTRVELMQANSQLLEAIHQKVELSQQLEQFQMDMQELIDEQMKEKLNNSRKKKDPTPPTITKKLTTYRLWSLFNR